MKVFHCGHCDQLVFFENSACTSCGRTLAYLADRTEMGTLEPVMGHQWRVLSPGKEGQAYRLCLNYSRENVCNWAVPVDDPNPYCRSCRLNRVIPNLSRPGTREAWARLEAAKRRLIYSLLCLHLPVSGKAENPQRGLAFEFLADPAPGTPGAISVPTGHLNGVITIDVAEAHDAERETRRLQMHEPYRTLLGHFRHEIGHYYWDRLIHGTDHVNEFRRFFGDERQDYGQMLQRHHQQGVQVDWAMSFVSAYASAHPWEDWAETWAHYLHVTDTLETATPVRTFITAETIKRARVETRDPRRRPMALVVRPNGRTLVPADLRAQQLEPLYGTARRLSFRPAHSGAQQAPVCAQGRPRT